MNKEDVQTKRKELFGNRKKVKGVPPPTENVTSRKAIAKMREVEHPRWDKPYGD